MIIQMKSCEYRFAQFNRVTESYFYITMKESYGMVVLTLYFAFKNLSLKLVGAKIAIM